MGYGVAITFFAVGAILAFAVRLDIGGIDLQMIGWIFMGVGVVSALLTLAYFRPVRRQHVTGVEGQEPLYTSDPDYPPGYIEPHVHRRPEAPGLETRPHMRRDDLR